MDPSHRDNADEAAFFQSFGFTREAWQVLAAALRAHPLLNAVIASSQPSHGRKYVVQCHMPTPNGRNPCIRSIWMVDDRQPRLVIAYPTRAPGA